MCGERKRELLDPFCGEPICQPPALRNQRDLQLCGVQASCKLGNVGLGTALLHAIGQKQNLHLKSPPPGFF